jgi:hypothetical protein
MMVFVRMISRTAYSVQQPSRLCDGSMTVCSADRCARS